MEFIIKPINSTGTVSFVDNADRIHVRKLELPDTKIVNQKSMIPLGIFKVIKSERNRLIFILIIGVILFFVKLLAVLFLYFNVFKTENDHGHWSAYIIPVLGMLYYLYKIPSVLIEYMGFKKSTKMYEESLKLGSTFTPPYISGVYIKLHKNQIKSLWLTVAICFYGAIFTLVFWWLSEVEAFFGFINLKEKFDASFKTPFTPQVLTIILAVTLGVILFSYFFFTVLRKKRIVNIEAFFGQSVFPREELEKIKTNLNKILAKIFFLSVLIFLLLPIIVRLLYKKFKKP